MNALILGSSSHRAYVWDCGVRSLGSIALLGLLLTSPRSEAQILSNSTWGLNTAPANFFQESSGSTASGGYVGPSLSPYRAAYTAFAHVTATAAPPALPGALANTSAEVRMFSDYALLVRGPGVVIVLGSGSAAGSVTGTVNNRPDGSPLPNSAIVTAGGLAFSPLIDHWVTGIDIMVAQDQTQSAQAVNVITIPDGREIGLRMNDGTRALARAQTDRDSGTAVTTATAEGGWTATFIPKPQRSAVSQSSCPQFDTRNGTVFILIHGWNSDNTTPWVQKAATGIFQSHPGSTIMPFDWREGANTGCDLGQKRKQASRALNHARIAGRQLASQICKALSDPDCVVDLSRIHIVAHSYGGEVANTAAAELNRLGKGRIGTVTLIDIPQQLAGGVASGLAPAALIADFRTENFGRVNNLVVDQSLTGVGAGLEGDDNTANVRLNIESFSGEGLDHNRAAMYAACLFGSDPDDPALGGTLAPGDYAESGPGVEPRVTPVPEGTIRPVALVPSPRASRFYDSSATRRNVDISGEQHINFCEKSPAVITTHLTVPLDADYIRFSYRVPLGGDGDSLSLQFNDELLFFADAAQTPANVRLDSGLIDIGYLQGMEGELSMVLNSTGEANAQFVVEDLGFHSAQPVMWIARGESGLKFSWSGAAPGFALQSSTDVCANPNWLAVTNIVFYTNTLYTVTVDTSDDRRFFRLAKP